METTKRRRRGVVHFARVFAPLVVLFGVYTGVKGFEEERLQRFAADGFRRIESGATLSVISEAEQIKQYMAIGIPWRTMMTMSSVLSVRFLDLEIDLASLLGIDLSGVSHILCTAHFKDGAHDLEAYDKAVAACSEAITEGDRAGKNADDARFTRAMAYIKLAFWRTNALGNAEHDLEILAVTNPDARSYLEKIMLLKEALEKAEEKEKGKEKGRNKLAPLFKQPKDEGNEAPKGF